MNILRCTLSTLLIAGMALFTSCSKEGPEGPAGKDGNANVKSQIITIDSQDWNGSNGTYYAIMSSSILTADVVNNGSVMVYRKENDLYAALPMSIYIGVSTAHFNFGYTEGEVEILVQVDNEMDLDLGDAEYKIVAISGTAVNALTPEQLPDYEAVKAAFDLEE